MRNPKTQQYETLRANLHLYWIALARDEYWENKDRIPMSEDQYVYVSVRHLMRMWEHHKWEERDETP